MPIVTDGRIKFGQSISLADHTAMVTVEVFGGPIVAVQVAVFNAKNEVVAGVGIAGHGEPLTSEATGSVEWLFAPPPGAAYIKWGVLTMRSAANLSSYSVTGKVRDSQGNTLVAGRYSGLIPDGELNDSVVYDGVKLTDTQLAAIPQGAHA